MSVLTSPDEHTGAAAASKYRWLSLARDVLSRARWLNALLSAGDFVQVELFKRILGDFRRKQDEQNAAIWRELSSMKAAIAELETGDQVPLYALEAHNTLLLWILGRFDEHEEYRLSEAVAGVEEYQTRIYERESINGRG